MVNILVQWLMTGFISLVHPFYISMVEINHNANDKTVEISVRVFTEDFEKTLQKKTTTRLDIIKPQTMLFSTNRSAIISQTKIKIKSKRTARNTLLYGS
jgi:molybdenum cofactor biosynthesis enzyme